MLSILMVSAERSFNLLFGYGRPVSGATDLGGVVVVVVGVAVVVDVEVVVVVEAPAPRPLKRHSTRWRT